MAREHLYSDLGACFGPAGNLSARGDKDVWRVIPYRTGEIRGTLLSSLTEGVPRDISFNPGLTGWYRIYVCIPAFSNLLTKIRLSGDTGFFQLSPLRGNWICGELEESFWRYAKMDGQSVVVSKANLAGMPGPAMLAWLRFVEMTDDEVAALAAERARTDTRCLYVCDDTHNHLCRGDPTVPGFWDEVTVPYEDSDAEWLSVERVSSFVSGGVPGGDIAAHAFGRSCDRCIQEHRHLFDEPAAHAQIVRQGHARGLKVSLSLRMGAWGIGFPFDQCYFDYPFFQAHPEWRCVMRDGVPAPAFSYAFPEVRDHIVGMLLEMADSGCDAVTLIAHRGVPYVLFEEPVRARFRERYGEDPCDLPLDDPRLNALHCGIMAEFFRTLRKALDKAHPDRHVGIHLRTFYSVYDTKYVGLDARALAQEGLVDALVCYPRRYREPLGEGCVKPDGRIDMARYRAFVNDPGTQAFLCVGDNGRELPPHPDSRGVPQGPADLAAHVGEWVDIERETGVRVYFDIMPRVQPPEDLRRQALAFYDAGARRFALWDCIVRVNVRAMWDVARRLGHEDWLRRDGAAAYRTFRVHELNGDDVSRYLPIWGG